MHFSYSHIKNTKSSLHFVEGGQCGNEEESVVTPTVALLDSRMIQTLWAGYIEIEFFPP